MPRRLAAADRTRWVTIGAIVLGVVLRLAFAFGYWVDKPLTLDEREYLLLANSIDRGEGPTYPTESGRPAERHFERPPAFAFFVAGLLKAMGHPLASAPRDETGMPRGFPRSSTDVPASIKITQSLLGGVIIVLIAALTTALAGRTAGAVAAMRSRSAGSVRNAARNSATPSPAEASSSTVARRSSATRPASAAS